MQTTCKPYFSPFKTTSFITLKESNEVHELWLDYLYSTSVMYHKIDPYVTINQWQAFLIDERINDLVHSFYLSRDLQIFY